MEKKADQIKNFSIGFLPHILVLGAFVALIFVQPDFGTVFILAALTWIMLFIGGVRFSQLLVGGGRSCLASVHLPALEESHLAPRAPRPSNTPGTTSGTTGEPNQSRHCVLPDR